VLARPIHVTRHPAEADGTGAIRAIVSRVMVRTFANLHIATVEDRESSTHGAVLATLSKVAARFGLSPSRSDESADTVVVVTRLQGWIAVHDDVVSSFGRAELSALADELSETTGSAVISTSVEGGSSFLVRLHRAGRVADTLPKRVRGRRDASAWSDLVRSGVTPESLRAAAESTGKPVEGIVETIGGFVGIGPETILAGATERAVAVDDDRTTVLRFRYEDDEDEDEDEVDDIGGGPTRFVATGPVSAQDQAVGGPFCVGATVRNAGATSRGLTVTIRGSAIERGLVVIERLELVRDGGGSDVDVEEFAAPPPHEGTIVARCPGYTITGAETVGPAVSALVDLEIMRATTVHVKLRGRGVVVGVGDVTITVEPDEASAGAATTRREARIVPSPRIPRHGAEPDPMRYRVLEESSRIELFAAFDGDREAAATAAAAAIERCSVHWPAGTKVAASIDAGVDAANPRSTGRRRSFDVERMATSGSWKKLRAELANALHVHGELHRPGDPAGCWRLGGFTFGGSRFGSRTEADADLALLRIAIDIQGMAPADVDRTVASVRDIADELVGRSSCAQAFVARWGAEAHIHYDATAYERCCGIGGTLMARRSWATRFLRGVSRDAMWLGPALVARVDTAALRAIAESTNVGSSVRVVLRPDATLDALEASLDPILPTREHARRAFELERQGLVPTFE